MAEYIEREAVMMYAKLICHTAYSRANKIRDDEIEKAINDIPAADVAPVRHGKWIETTQPIGWDDVTCAECSECGEDFVLDEWGMDDMKNLMHYCPNCGAKMEVDE